MKGYRTNTISLEQYIEDVHDETINTKQAVQRDFVWTDEMIDNLISSAASDEVYIPSIILAEEYRDGIKITYVVDGNQRTEALRRFAYEHHKIGKKVRNPIVKYKTKKLDENGKVMRNEEGEVVWENREFDLRGKEYDDMPKDLKKQFNKCQLTIATYQDCTTEETSDKVMLYNNHAGMNVSEKSLTYIGKYAENIKRIKENNTFLKDGTYLTEKDKKKGFWERIISECVMGIFHMDNWKSDPRVICDYLNSNSSIKEFDTVEEYFSRIAPYSDKIDHPDVAKLFIPKDMVVWLKVFEKFTKTGLEDKRFGEFLEAFVTGLNNTKLGELDWEELDSNRRTKDRSVIEQKVNYIATLMNEYLHIENVEEFVPEEKVADAATDIEAALPVDQAPEDDDAGILGFVKENVSDSIEEEDVELYTDIIEDTVRTNSPIYPLYNNCATALIALMAYACSMDHDRDLEEWIKSYKGKTRIEGTVKDCFTYIKNDFVNYIHTHKEAAA